MWVTPIFLFLHFVTQASSHPNSHSFRSIQSTYSLQCPVLLTARTPAIALIVTPHWTFFFRLGAALIGIIVASFLLGRLSTSRFLRSRSNEFCFCSLCPTNNNLSRSKYWYPRYPYSGEPLLPSILFPWRRYTHLSLLRLEPQSHWTLLIRP